MIIININLFFFLSMVASFNAILALIALICLFLICSIIIIGSLLLIKIKNNIYFFNCKYYFLSQMVVHFLLILLCSKFFLNTQPCELVETIKKSDLDSYYSLYPTPEEIRLGKQRTAEEFFHAWKYSRRYTNIQQETLLSKINGSNSYSRTVMACGIISDCIKACSDLGLDLKIKDQQANKVVKDLIEDLLNEIKTNEVELDNSLKMKEFIFEFMKKTKIYPYKILTENELKDDESFNNIVIGKIFNAAKTTLSSTTYKDRVFGSIVGYLGVSLLILNSSLATMHMDINELSSIIFLEDKPVYDLFESISSKFLVRGGNIN